MYAVLKPDRSIDLATKAQHANPDRMHNADTSSDCASLCVARSARQRPPGCTLVPNCTVQSAGGTAGDPEYEQCTACRNLDVGRNRAIRTVGQDVHYHWRHKRDWSGYRRRAGEAGRTGLRLLS